MPRGPSGNTLKVLSFFLEEPNCGRYGLEITRATRVGSGSLYPLLEHLESDGYLAGAWEEIDEKEEGRRRRRYYQLTPTGRVWAEAQLAGLWQSAPRLRLGGV